MIENFEPFVGSHCETTTNGNLLRSAGMELSEPMLVGIGEGLAFVVFVIKGVPFIGGRPKPEDITRNLVRHLGLDVEFRTTRSKTKAWDNVASFIDAGQPVGVKLDSYFLEYFKEKVHFAGHYVTAVGYDDDRVHVIDTAPNGRSNSTSRESFEEARMWKGPMSSDALTWTITPRKKPNLRDAIENAISANMESFLNPPISNLGYKGISKAAKLVPTWRDTMDDDSIRTVGMLMERGGTGGGLFRNFYADFLSEASDYLNSPALSQAEKLFRQSARMWTAVAGHIERVSVEGQAGLDEAGQIMTRIAPVEEESARLLVSM